MTGKEMHDNYVIGYNVNVEKKTIDILTYNNVKKKQITVSFTGVLTHSFKCIIDYNIIADINVCDVKEFVKENKEELKSMEGYCWPIDYNDEEELNRFLVNDKYKYIKILSSYGMSGWILAKEFEIHK